MTSTPITDAPCATNHLRCLIVDDNTLNLAILSMMLKRRFSHVLDGPPIAVDGGLKAIQALRQEVFDCILLDIQMPHISGIDICKRIRAGSDGILEANRSVIILATTTAVGPEPTALYRAVGMNGVLPKPVRPAHLASFLGPLVRTVKEDLVPRGDGSMVRAPQASAIRDSFFMPDSDAADVLSAMSRPDICDGGNFEGALAEQTRASLKRVGMAGRSSTISGAPHRVRPSAVRIKSDESASTISSGVSSGGEDLPSRIADAFNDPHRRGNSVSISSRTLKDQLAREVAQMEALEPSSEASDSENSDMPSPLAAPSSISTTVATSSPVESALPPRAVKSSPTPGLASPPPARIRRPLVHHRASSPAWLAKWESAIEAPDMPVDSGFTSESANSGANTLVESPWPGSADVDPLASRPRSAPSSPVAVPAPATFASPVRPRLPRPRIRTEISDDGSGSGSGSVSGFSNSTSHTSSLSAAWSSFSLHTPSEEERGSASSYFSSSRNASPERRRSSACTMATLSTDTSLASSPRSEYPPALIGTNGLINPEDNFTKPTSTLVPKLALPAKVVIVSEEDDSF